MNEGGTTRGRWLNNWNKLGLTVLKSLSDEGVGVVCQVADLCPISIRPLPTFSGSKVFPTIQQRPLTFHERFSSWILPPTTPPLPLSKPLPAPPGCSTSSHYLVLQATNRPGAGRRLSLPPQIAHPLFLCLDTISPQMSLGPYVVSGWFLKRVGGYPGSLPRGRSAATANVEFRTMRRGRPRKATAVHIGAFRDCPIGV